MSRTSALSVLDHHAELMKIDRDSMSNVDAKAIYEQLYRDATEARANVAALIAAANRALPILAAHSYKPSEDMSVYTDLLAALGESK